MAMTRSRLISGAAIFAVVVVCAAQQPAAKWNELQRHPIPGTAHRGGHDDD